MMFNLKIILVHMLGCRPKKDVYHYLYRRSFSTHAWVQALEGLLSLPLQQQFQYTCLGAGLRRTSITTSTIAVLVHLLGCRPKKDFYHYLYNSSFSTHAWVQALEVQVAEICEKPDGLAELCMSNCMANGEGQFAVCSVLVKIVK